MIASLETHLGYWLRLVSNQVSRSFAAKVEGHGVTVAEWVVLRELYDHPGAQPSELADRLDLTRGAISKLAERLIAKSLVLRSDSETDLRAHRLALTRAGRALVPRLAALADRNDSEFFSDLIPTEQEQLKATLQTIVRRKGLRGAPID